jgi:hypothetical protein
MRKATWLLRGAALIGLALPAALMLGPAASQASALPSANFAAQARAAHLSTAQRATLQSEVNKIIARYGGRQVALNEIALPHGASVLFPLPGQRVARVLPGTPPIPVNTARVARPGQAGHAVPGVATVPGTRAVHGQTWSAGETWYAADGASCSYYYFCSWQGQNYTGEQFNVSECNVWQEYPGSGWNGNGSFTNNQTFGTTAYLGAQDEEIIAAVSASEPATGPSTTPDFNWEPYWYAMACYT